MANNPAQNPVTTLRGYPLPVGANALSDDVARLGTALNMLDTDVAAAATKLISIRSITSNYQVVASDNTVLIDYNGASANDVVTLPLLGGVAKGFNVQIRNSTSLSISVGTSGGATINGNSLYALLPSTTIEIVSDSATWKVLSIAQVSSGSLTSAGTLSLPAHSFSPDTTVGMYLPSVGQGALVATGVAALVWANNGILIGSAAGGFKGAGTVNAAKLFYAGQDLIARNDGTAGAPTYSFGSEASLGLYRAGSGVLGMAAQGVLQFAVSATGMVGTGATAVSGTQIMGSANLTDLYLNGVSLGSALTFGPSGVAVAGVSGGVKGAGTLNASDLFIKGGSLSTLLGLNGVAGGTLNLTDVQIAGESLASRLNFSASGVVVVGATGGPKGAGSLNVGSLYINGALLNPGLITPTLSNALGYLRVNGTGDAIEYRSPSQLLNDLGVQTALGYVPVNRNGDTMTALTVTGSLEVGAAVTFNSTLNVLGTAGLQNLAVATAATVGGTLAVGGGTTLAAASATSLTVLGSLGVSGAATLAAVTATTVRLTGNLTVVGSTILAGLTASQGTFAGAVSMSATLSVAGTATVGRLTTSTATIQGSATFSGGIALQAGHFAVGVGQRFTTLDPANGFQFQSANLGSPADSVTVVAQFATSVGVNAQSLRFIQHRLTDGSDWTSSVMRLQMQTDAASQAYIEWGATASGLGGLRFGAISSTGADVAMLGLDGDTGVTLYSNVSVNSFLGVGGGAQLNGGVTLTGGVSVDTLVGSANWSTTGNITCHYLTQTSDERLKADIGGIDEANAVSFVQKAEPVSFRWRAPADESEAGRRHFGYRAQQIQTAGYHNLVRTAPRAGMQDALSMDYSGTIPLLHVALRRAMRQIEHLQSRLDRLESHPG